MNKFFVIGNLTKDPETSTTQSGVQKCTFTVAAQRKYKNDDGNYDADFIRITAWRQLAELCSRYLKKGRRVFVAGNMYSSSYTDNDGKMHFNLEHVAEEIEFQPSGKADQNASSAKAGAPAANDNVPVNGGFVQVDDDDLPF